MDTQTATIIIGIASPVISAAAALGGAWWGGRISAKVSRETQLISLYSKERDAVIELITIVSELENTFKRNPADGHALSDKLISKSIAAQCSASSQFDKLFAKYREAYIPIASLSVLCTFSEDHDKGLIAGRKTSTKDHILRLCQIVSEQMKDTSFTEQIQSSINNRYLLPLVGGKLHDALGNSIYALQGLNNAYMSEIESIGISRKSSLHEKGGMFTPHPAPS